jgi:hypothetical protein
MLKSSSYLSRVVTAFILLFLVTACTQNQKLTFGTIEQQDLAGTGEYFETEGTGMLVISRPEEVAELNNKIRTDTKAKLEALDYSTYFALAVFQGQKPSTGYMVTVDRIIRQKDKVNVYIAIREPAPHEGVNESVTSPYHLVKVQKSGEWGQNFTFDLIEGKTVIESLFHYIP